MKTKHQNARPKIVEPRSFDPHIATIASEKFKLKLLGQLKEDITLIEFFVFFDDVVAPISIIFKFFNLSRFVFYTQSYIML